MIMEKAVFETESDYGDHIRAAKGENPCDLVLKNGQFLDVFNGRFIAGDVAIYKNHIVGVEQSYHGLKEIDLKGTYIVPGFIDSHVHIESSLMTPRVFEKAVLPCGTTSVIWDPHEIANVWGVKGIEWAIESSANLLLDIFIMLPSCVPATSPTANLESSAHLITSEDLAPFANHPRVLGLAEMMNFPGLLSGDTDILKKLNSFKNSKRDGHCPGLTSYELNAYAACGIHSCHESVSLEESREKLSKGIHILIREGSCAKNAKELLPLLNSYTSSVLALCSDDRNPLDIEEEGHLDSIINMALKSNHQPEIIFRTASYGAATAYGLLDRGAIAPGYRADLCLVEPQDKAHWNSGFCINKVVKNGSIVDFNQEDGRLKESPPKVKAKNLILNEFTEDDFCIQGEKGKKQRQARVIEVIDGQIVTQELKVWVDSAEKDLLHLEKQAINKISVFERHTERHSHCTALVKGFSLNKGAIATSVNHDSHNCIVVGSSNFAMKKALEALQEIDGGIVVFDGEHTKALQLPYAGLMSDQESHKTTLQLQELKKAVQEMGCPLSEPFLLLSFLALPVIGDLKITDRGLVDVRSFSLVPVLD